MGVVVTLKSKMTGKSASSEGNSDSTGSRATTVNPKSKDQGVVVVLNAALQGASPNPI